MGKSRCSWDQERTNPRNDPVKWPSQPPSSLARDSGWETVVEWLQDTPGNRKTAEGRCQLQDAWNRHLGQWWPLRYSILVLITAPSVLLNKLYVLLNKIYVTYILCYIFSYCGVIFLPSFMPLLCTFALPGDRKYRYFTVRPECLS